MSKKIPAIAFWVILWQVLALLFRKIYPNGHILLATPVECITRLAELVVTASFWRTAANSTLHIFGGFLIGCVLAVFFSACSARFSLIENLLAPVISVIKSVPVVSFIILALIWIDGRRLSLFISALISFPPIYLNMLSGIQSADGKLLEMAGIYHVSLWRKISGIYIPALMPHFISAVSLALGMCWKAGVSAEVIGLSSNTVGEKMYTAKVYFQTADLFAWSAVVVLLSVCIEKAVLHLLKLAAERSNL